jgi:hypothetical protein
MLLEEYKVRKQVCARRARGDGGTGGGAGGQQGGGDEHVTVECGAFDGGDGLGAGGGEL